MGPNIVVAIVGILLVTFLLVLPVKMAAAAMGARRTGYFSCLLALLGASIMQMLGLTVPVFGTVVAFLLSALAFAAILQTTFIRGVGIAILHVIFSAIIVAVLAAVFGLSLAAHIPHPFFVFLR